MTLVPWYRNLKPLTDEEVADGVESARRFIRRSTPDVAIETQRLIVELGDRLDRLTPAKPAAASGAEILKRWEDEDVRRGAVGPIRVHGRWRVYFHRLNPDGLPWCVSSESGGWELAVRSVGILVPTQAVYQPKAKPDDDDGRPSAWIEADGVLVVSDDGRATIEAA